MTIRNKTRFPLPDHELPLEQSQHDGDDSDQVERERVSAANRNLLPLPAAGKTSTETSNSFASSSSASAIKQTVITIIDAKPQDEPTTNPPESTDVSTVPNSENTGYNSYWQIPNSTSAPVNAYWQIPQAPPSSTSTLTPSPTQPPSTQYFPPLVNLVLTEATLLSGSLEDCFNADDESCEAGVAAVAAFKRHLAHNQPTLVFPKFEKQSQFVQVHPLGWSVNRLILQGLMGWDMLMSTPSLLLQNQRDGYGSQRDLSYLQAEDFPFLITNVNVPPSSSWASYYHQYIHFDETTGIALLSIANSGEPLNHGQVHSAWGALHIIADKNKQNHCLPPADKEEARRQQLFQSYQEIYMNGETARQQPTAKCWIPVVSFDDSQSGMFPAFIEGIMKHPHPPALIIDVDNNAPDQYPIPMLIHFQVNSNGNTTAATDTLTSQTANITSATTTTMHKSVWIHSFGRKDDIYYQHQLHLTQEFPPQLVNVTLIQQDMEVVPAEYRDETYAKHIQYLRQQADQAIQNDPVVGHSTEFPVARDGEYRRCQGGECEIGNLFTDALKWKANADVAFVTSGGLRGEGWPAGPVKISNIWAALPFPNGLCQGVMSGLSLFRLLDYSISVATFESWDTNDGGRLLQVAGLHIHYNTQIPRGTSRILTIHIWNHAEEKWEPIERLRLYKFATDSYLCGAYTPFPQLLGAGGNFTLEGEVPGVIGDDLVQNVVAEYLQQLDYPYEAGIEKRMDNSTDFFNVLDLVQTEDGCPAKTYWSERRGACFDCPDSTHVGFSDERLVFNGQLNWREGGVNPTEETKESTIFNATALNITDPNFFENVLQGRVLLVNRELTNFSVVPKAIPSWLKFIDSESGQYSAKYVVGGPATVLPSGGSLALDFIVGNENSDAGTAIGTVSFGILGRAVEGDEGIRSCDDYSRDATFDVSLSISPPQETAQLGNYRYGGLTLMCVTLATATFFGFCLFKYRKTAILKTMQPLFLVTICCGVFIMALTILPLSLDDQVLSEDGADAACMAIPWLLSMGLTVTFSALFSKLWRVNKLFNVQSFRRMRVTEYDVLAPFVLLFAINAILLTVWNVVDPLRSERLSVEGEEWKTYPSCRAGDLGYSLMYSAAAVNCVALILACCQAYKARNISDEFAESRSLGLAIVCWVQVLLVGFPALYLVDPEDIAAVYFLRVGLLFVLCMSMMIIIFGPLLLMVFQYRKNPGSFAGRGARGSVYVTGTASHYEASSLHGGGSFVAVSQPFGKRESRHSTWGTTDKVAMMKAVASAASHGSASSLGSSYDKQPFSKPSVIPEEFNDEEKDTQEKAKTRKDSTKSATSSSGNGRAEADDSSLSDSLVFSLATMERPTEQMLLDDLVPREAQDSFLNTSDSTVPFSGGDFGENLLGDDDSDSSVPFQGHDNPNEEISPTGPLADIPVDISPRNNYSQHLLQGSDKMVFGGSSDQFHNSGDKVIGSFPPDDETKDCDENVVSVVTVPVIATIENRKAKAAEEIPFSSRFVDYKNRWSALSNEEKVVEAPEDAVLAAIEASHNGMRDHSSQSAGSIGMRDRSDKRITSLRSMRDRSDQNGSRRRIFGFGGMKDRSDGSNGLQRGNVEMVERSDRNEHTRRRQDQDDCMLKSEEEAADNRYPWEREGKRPSDMLGYSVSDEYAFEPHGKKKPSSLKGKISAFHQSFAALNFTAGGGSGFGHDDDGRLMDSPKKKASAFSTLHQSFAALNFAGAGKSSGEPGGGFGDSPRRQVKTSAKSAYASLHQSVPALHFNHGESDSVSSLEVYEKEASETGVRDA